MTDLRKSKLLILDQAFVEDLIRDLVDGRACPFGNDKKISSCRGTNQTNPFM